MKERHHDKDIVSCNEKTIAVLYSEEEIMAAAREVLGAVPGWYLTNKETVAKNKTEQLLWTNKVVVEINDAVERFCRTQAQFIRALEEILSKSIVVDPDSRLQ